MSTITIDIRALYVPTDNYADILFTNYKHWRVTQTGRGGTTNWFPTRFTAGLFQALYGGKLTGATCEDFESAWPEDWREPHMHGASPDGERQRATEPDTARSDARRSQRLGRLV